jgi:hypothetical protein
VKRPTTILTNDSARIKYEAERFFAGGPFELYEDDRFIASIEPSQGVVEIRYGKPILSCWGPGWSRAWRILACEPADDILQLDCVIKMGQVRCALEFRRGGQTSRTSASGGEFVSKIAALIEINFATFKVNHISTAPQDARHRSGVHTRLILNDSGKRIAAVAIGKSQSQAQIDATLSAGLIWLEELRSRDEQVKRLMLFMPAGQAFTIACRLVYVQPAGIDISLYELDEKRQVITQVSPFAQADLIDNLKGVGRQTLVAQEKSPRAKLTTLIDGLNSLVPEVLDTQERGGWIYLSIRGLTLARISTRQVKVEFGLQAPRKQLTEANRSELEDLLIKVAKNRTADVKSRNDELFRLQGERWLEALIRKEVSVIDPMLDSHFVYSQVPAYRGTQRSYIDVLTATRAGQLVIMELKVSEDREFPLQGLDYWMRIDWHRLRGDFERRGYFKGLKLLDRPPRLYLVAPLFRFHATTKLIASAISSQVPLYRIGINEDWRSGVRVLLSERLNEQKEKG